MTTASGTVVQTSQVSETIVIDSKPEGYLDRVGFDVSAGTQNIAIPVGSAAPTWSERRILLHYPVRSTPKARPSPRGAPDAGNHDHA
jgi:hypothetical protein